MYFVIERETDVHRLSYLKDDTGALKMEIPVTIKTLIRSWSRPLFVDITTK